MKPASALAQPLKPATRSPARACRLLALMPLLLAVQAAQAQFEYNFNSDGTLTVTDYTGPGGVVTIPEEIDGLPVTGIGRYAFRFNETVTEIIIPDSILNIEEWAFTICPGITNVSIGQGVTNIGDNVFAWCDGLTSVVVPDSVLSIGDWAFGWCFGLTNATIGKGAVFVGDSAFKGCPRLGAIAVDALNPFYSSVDGVLMNKIHTTLIRYPPNRPAGSYHVTAIVTNMVTGAFFFSFGLSNITVDPLNLFFNATNGVLFSKDQRTLIFFPVAKPVSEYTIPNSVTTIAGEAFYWCTNLLSVAIPKGVVSIDDFAFSGCERLVALKIPTTVTSLGREAFSYCRSATNLWIPESVTNIDNSAFSGCKSLGSVAIPNSIDIIMNGVFAGCASLTNVTIPNSVTSILSYAFARCSNLTSFSVGDNISSLGNCIFQSCVSLSSISIGTGVTYIGSEAFLDCSALNTVTLGTNVATIDMRVFADCPSLTGVYFKGDAPTFGWKAFDGTTTNATIFYPPGTAGWGPTAGGVPTVLWNPQIQTGDASFGVRTNRFGFNITGTSNLVIVVEATTHLTNPAWSVVGTNILTDGTSYFSDPQWTNHPARFYRLRSP